MAKKAGLNLMTYFVLANFFVISQLSFSQNCNNQKNINNLDITQNASIIKSTDTSVTSSSCAGSTSTNSSSTNSPITNVQDKSSPEAPKQIIPGIIEKIQDINIKKTANKTFYYSIGSASTILSIGSLCGLIYLFKKMDEMKKSYIKNFVFGIATKIALYFENKTQYKKYMIPGAIVGLSVNAALTAIMAIWMFRAGYKA